MHSRNRKSLVEENPVVRTRSANVDKICKTLLELMPAHAPDAPALQDLAQEYAIVDYHIGLSCEGKHAAQIIQRALWKRQLFETNCRPSLAINNHGGVKA